MSGAGLTSTQSTKPAESLVRRGWGVVKRTAGGILSFVLLMMCASAFGSGQKVVLLGMAALWAIFFVAVFVHEAGHALAAALAGWRVLIFAVRPLRLNLLTGQLGLARRPEGHDADVGGWVSAVPRHRAALTKARCALYVAGGPLANLLLAIVAFWSASTWLTAHDRPDLSVSTLGAVTGFVSAFLAVYNLFPGARSGLPSDGEHLRRIVRAGPDWAGTTAVASLATLIKYDARPRDKPRWMRDAWRTSGHEELASAAAALDISAALDTLPVDPAEVRGMIDAFRARHGDSEWLALCDAYLAAVWENDVARAEAVRWEGETSDDQRPLRLAVDAAIAARHGERDRAEALLRDMRIAARAAAWMRPVFRDIDDQVTAVVEGLI